MEREAYFRELSIRLQREGFTLLPEEEGFLPVEWNGASLCRVSEIGCARYRPEEVNAGGMETALTKATDITCTVLVGMQTQYGFNFVTWDRSFVASANSSQSFQTCHWTAFAQFFRRYIDVWSGKGQSFESFLLSRYPFQMVVA